MQVNDLNIKVPLVGEIFLREDETLITHFQMLEGMLEGTLSYGLRHPFISLLQTVRRVMMNEIGAKNNRKSLLVSSISPFDG
jgi:hypothetical protein